MSQTNQTSYAPKDVFDSVVDCLTDWGFITSDRDVQSIHIQGPTSDKLYADVRTESGSIDDGTYTVSSLVVAYDKGSGVSTIISGTIGGKPMSGIGANDKRTYTRRARCTCGAKFTGELHYTWCDWNHDTWVGQD